MFEKSVSEIQYYDEWVRKIQPKTMADREFSALMTLKDTGFVPEAWRMGQEKIDLKRVFPSPVTDVDKFRDRCDSFLSVLDLYGLRHGDLTVPHVLPVDNSPIIIDWSECRWDDEPIPDKRVRGDRYWLSKTFDRICNTRFGLYHYYEFHNTRAHEIIGFIESALGNEMKEINTVFDAGFGHADLLMYFNKERGRRVSGIDIDKDLVDEAIKKVYYEGQVPAVNWVCLENWAQSMLYSKGSEHFIDLSICTSVIPYLKDKVMFMIALSKVSKRAILEIQSAGDGPGTIRQDKIKDFIEQYFNKVYVIGRTFVKDKKFSRWLFYARNL